jgi:hypothetical protein
MFVEGDRNEIRQSVCFFLHQRFIGNMNQAKLLHFQGYSDELIPLTVSSIPSMRMDDTLYPMNILRSNICNV